MLSVNVLLYSKYRGGFKDNENDSEWSKDQEVSKHWYNETDFCVQSQQYKLRKKFATTVKHILYILFWNFLGLHNLQKHLFWDETGIGCIKISKSKGLWNSKLLNE